MGAEKRQYTKIGKQGSLLMLRREDKDSDTVALLSNHK